MGLAWPYFVALALVAGILLYKHSLVSPTDMSRFGVAFFRINAYVSTSVFAGTLAALLI
jgi:4-hydroxybenzoate polyprenyltransferase